MNYARFDQCSATIVQIEGPLDALSFHDLTPLLDELATGRQQTIVVDLSLVRLIDSAGIRCLASLCKRVRARGGQARVVGMVGQPRVLFELLGFEPDMSVKKHPFTPAMTPLRAAS